MASMEITTVIGCKNICEYCPQDVLIKSYSGLSNVKKMELDTFKKCIDKIPKEVRIHFSGMAEPWLNSSCTDMLLYAHKKGHKIRVFTTLNYMAPSDVERIKDIPFDRFTIHLPDKNAETGINVDSSYLSILSKIRSSIQNLTYLCHRGVSEKLKTAVHGLNVYEAPLCTRGNNVKLKWKKAARKRGKLKCKRHLNHNVLLPNGDVVLCCMDFGLNHRLGNLLTSSYASILNSKELENVKAAMASSSSEILCRYCMFSYRTIKPI